MYDIYTCSVPWRRSSLMTPPIGVATVLSRAAVANTYRCCRNERRRKAGVSGRVDAEWKSARGNIKKSQKLEKERKAESYKSILDLLNFAMLTSLQLRLGFTDGKSR